MRRTFLAMATGAAVVGLVATAPATVAAAQAPTPTWQVVPSPNVGTARNILNGVATVAADDVWTVGESNPGTTLAQHWDGSSWRVVPSPNLSFTGVDATILSDVTAVASNDVWAVGFGADFSSLQSQTLITHWDGASWVRVPSPNPGGRDRDRLLGVDAVAADDIWAVGSTAGRRAGSFRSLITHWDGSRWTEVPNPGVSELTGVHANATDDVWAVGSGTTLHWDGRSWTAVPLGTSFELRTLRDVSGTAADDVWAVGNAVDSFSGRSRPVIERWNGSAWTSVQAGRLPGQILNGVDAVSAGDAYAVGIGGTGGALILHWDGTTWTEVPNPRQGLASDLRDVDAVSAADLWAVGARDTDVGPPRTLTERATS